MRLVPELVQVVTRTNQRLATVSRPIVRKRNLIHRCSFTFVHNSHGHLLLQKRVAFKETFPSHFDPCPGGVLTVGESYEENAVRELEEELGVQAPVTALFDFFYEDDVCRLWGRAFRAVWDGPLQLQESEVESAEFLDMEEVQRRLATSPTCPDSLQAFNTYVNTVWDT